MSSEKNYYDILGVSKGASDEEIKKAYRNLAREHHPDMVKDSDKAGAEKRFKELNEAYQVLSNPDKKRMYDQFGTTGGPGMGGPGAGGQPGGGQWGPFSYSYSSAGGPQQGGFGGVDPFDIFEEVFGFRGFGGTARQKKGKNLYYEMRVDFADAIHGFERDISVESGKVKVKVPAGIRDGTEIRFPDKGMPGPDKTPPGDLFITFRVHSPAEFRVVGENIGIALEVDFVQAILGDNVEITVVDPSSKDGLGKKKLKIPAGTQHGGQIRLKGYGMPKIRSTGQGDIVVQIFVNIPKKLSRKQKQLLEEYKEL